MENRSERQNNMTAKNNSSSSFSHLCLQAVSVCWSCLQLPWLELDWFMDLSSRIVHLDLSSNCLVSLPSVLPWGLLRLHTLDLSNNLLKELPATSTSQEVICTRYPSPTRKHYAADAWYCKSLFNNGKSSPLSPLMNRSPSVVFYFYL